MERVYVGNLPPDIRIKDIDDFFRPFGKLVYIDVNNRANPVYAYVQFDSARNAFNAVKSRHGYDYEGYTLQLRLVENEVRKRRDATPPPPPPPMFSDYGSQNNRSGGFNQNNNNRLGGNFPNSSMSSFQTSFNSQWSNNNLPQQKQHQNISQYSGNNRVNMPQQNMMDYLKNSCNNMQQQNMMPYSSSGRANMQQQYSNTNISNMSQQQQFNNSSRSNMSQQQFSNLNRSNMSQQNMMNNSNTNRSDKFQQQKGIMNYSNTNRSNMQQQQNMNMMDYGHNSSWNSGNDNNMGSNSGNNNMGIGNRNNYNNALPNQIYNANNDPYARPGFEDNFTRGLSGSGRKWFNRYIRKGFSPKMARVKALEHRTVPYLRDDPKINNSIPNDPTNAALETIGNTIISLLSTNPVDNFNKNPSFSNWGGDNFQVGSGNFDMTGPSTSRGRGRMNRDTDLIRNMVSRIASESHVKIVANHMYTKTVGILEKINKKKIQEPLTQPEQLKEQFYKQIINEYEEIFMTKRTKDRRLRKNSDTSIDNTTEKFATTEVNLKIKERAILYVKQIQEQKLSTLFQAEQQNPHTNNEKTSLELLQEFNELKQTLLKQAKPNPKEPERKLSGEAKKKRTALMVQGGLREYEAKTLAILPNELFQKILYVKEEYNVKKKQEENTKSKDENFNTIVSNNTVGANKTSPNKLNDNIGVDTKTTAATTAGTRKLEVPVPLTNSEKSSNILFMELEDFKQTLLLKAKQKLSGEAKKKMNMLMVQGDFNENEANILAILSQQQLQILLDMKREYELKKISEIPLYIPKTSNDLLNMYENRKQALIEQAKPHTNIPEKMFSVETKQKKNMLILKGGLSEHEAKILAVVQLKKLLKLLDMKKTYEIMKRLENTTTTENNITEKNDKELHTPTSQSQ